MGEEIMAEWEAIKEYLTCLVDTGYDPADRGLKNLGAQARLRHIAAAAAFTARVQELIGEDVVPRGTLVLELSPETLENIRKLAAAGAP